MTEKIYLNQRGTLYYNDFFNLMYYASHYSKHKEKPFKTLSDLLNVQPLEEWIIEFNNVCHFLVFYN